MMLPKESATFSSCRFNCFMAFLIPNSRYSVEVITFDDESYTIEVEARSAEEAQEIAASQ